MRYGMLLFADSAAGSRACARRVAGLTLLDRGVRTLVRAGIERVTVVVPRDARVTLPRHTRRLSARIDVTRWEDVGRVDVPADERVLVVLGEYVHHHRSLAAFRRAAAAADADVVALAAPRTDGASGAQPLRLRAGRESGPARDADAEWLSVGVFCVAGRLLRADRLRPAGTDFQGFLSSQLGDGQTRIEPADPALWRVAADRRGARAAKAMLFGQVTKPTSGFVSRHINARISIPISKLLVETGMSPHAITVVFVLTTGLAAAILVSRPAPYWRLATAALLWQLAAILDRCDGEVARVKLCESAFGAWFDTVTDNISYLGAYSGLVLGVHRLHPTSPLPLLLGATAVIALLVTLAIMYTYARRTGSGSLQHYLRDLSHNVPDEEKTVVQWVMQHYGFMAKRDFFSFVLALVLLSGKLEAVYGLTLVLLYSAAAAVLVSQRTMLRSATASAGRAAVPAGGRTAAEDSR